MKDSNAAASFIMAAHNACVDADRPYIFTCPVCGGTARARKAASNGHVHAECRHCGMQVME